MDQSWKDKSLEKIVSPEKLKEKVQEIRKKNKTIATSNGSYDILHAGHLEIIYQASKQADVLIVALNSDESIKRYKNPLRPIVPLEYRMQMMSALSFVDYVTWFDEIDPRQILQIIKPDVHVIGIEYKDRCVEEPLVVENGGKMFFVNRVGSLSTTELVNKIRQCV